MKEWVKAPSVGVVLPLTHLQNLVSFPRYGRLKKKCWYKQICNGTYWLLLTGHFGPVFVRPSQWSITAVRGRTPPGGCQFNTAGKLVSGHRAQWAQTNLHYRFLGLYTKDTELFILFCDMYVVVICAQLKLFRLCSQSLSSTGPVLTVNWAQLSNEYRANDTDMLPESYAHRKYIVCMV